MIITAKDRMKEMHVYHRFSQTKNHIDLVQFPDNFSLNIF